MFFFFQAEDGIRDYKVTGVQTCALPIYWTSLIALARAESLAGSLAWRLEGLALPGPVEALLEAARRDGEAAGVQALRSEERRVGKEGRSRWRAGEDTSKRGATRKRTRPR